MPGVVDHLKFRKSDNPDLDLEFVVPHDYCDFAASGWTGVYSNWRADGEETGLRVRVKADTIQPCKFIRIISIFEVMYNYENYRWTVPIVIGVIALSAFSGTRMNSSPSVTSAVIFRWPTFPHLKRMTLR